MEYLIVLYNNHTNCYTKEIDNNCRQSTLDYWESYFNDTQGGKWVVTGIYRLED